MNFFLNVGALPPHPQPQRQTPTRTCLRLGEVDEDGRGADGLRPSYAPPLQPLTHSAMHRGGGTVFPRCEARLRPQAAGEWISPP